MPDWRDEVCSALDFWISAEGGARQAERLACLGAARQESLRGWYSVDSRSILNVDQVESLHLSGKGGPGTGPAYPVLDAMQDGPVMCPFTGSVELGVPRLAKLGRFVAACPI